MASSGGWDADPMLLRRQLESSDAKARPHGGGSSGSRGARGARRHLPSRRLPSRRPAALSTPRPRGPIQWLIRFRTWCGIDATGASIMTRLCCVDAIDAVYAGASIMAAYMLLRL
jgi:hypothetical protein